MNEEQVITKFEPTIAQTSSSVFTLQPDNISGAVFLGSTNANGLNESHNIISSDKVSFVFSGSALEKLKELSQYLGKLPNEVLLTGMQLIDISQKGKFVLEKDNKVYDIDVKKI